MTLNVIERVKEGSIFIEKRANKIKRNFGGLNNDYLIINNQKEYDVDRRRLIFKTILVFNIFDTGSEMQSSRLII